MNSTQIQNIAAPVVAFIAAWLAGKIPGIDQGAWSGLINSIILIITGAALGYINRQSALITAVAQQPEVKSVVLEQTAPAALVQSTPSNVTK
jgi:uncharacterized membrane protein YeaQ/YmgE (transglycosylase-associated protein family)